MAETLSFLTVIVFLRFCQHAKPQVLLDNGLFGMLTESKRFGRLAIHITTQLKANLPSPVILLNVSTVKISYGSFFSVIFLL